VKLSALSFGQILEINSETRGSLKSVVKAMSAAAHAFNGIPTFGEPCLGNILLLQNYKALEKKLTVEDLKAILVFPALRLDCIGDFMKVRVGKTRASAPDGSSRSREDKEKLVET
jgi:hypothetical protein